MFGESDGFLGRTRTLGDETRDPHREHDRRRDPLDQDQTRARCSRTTDCHCGQQLDMCARAHCPRCGRSIQPD